LAGAAALQTARLKRIASYQPRAVITHLPSLAEASAMHGAWGVAATRQVISVTGAAGFGPPRSN
jgi:hypothetical protein